jgi:hypothetical protein
MNLGSIMQQLHDTFVKKNASNNELTIWDKYYCHMLGSRALALLPSFYICLWCILPKLQLLWLGL